MRVITSTAISLLLLISIGCHSKAGLRGAEPEIVTFVAQDDSFSGPKNIAAGRITVRLINEGRDPHHLQFIKLIEGKTSEDFIAAVNAAPLKTPSWARYAGGPNAVVSQETSEATIDLSAGEYVTICQVPDREGKPHMSRGMFKSVRVTSASSLRKGPPRDSADSVVRAIDFRFNVQQPLRSGRQRIRFVNRGSQPHELVVVELVPNATLKDFVDSLGTEVFGTAPGRPLGGVTGLEQDEEGSFPLNLPSGHYGLICLFIDASGTSHYAKGMATEFDVE